MRIVQLKLSQIRTDGGTQQRAAIDLEWVAELVEAILAKLSLPPLLVYHDGKHYWLVDGFHRLEAYRQAGVSAVYVEVRPGSQREAILASAGANQRHGLRRTNADKRRAVLVMVADPEWGVWPNREIARHCGVSEGLVRNVRCVQNADSDTESEEEDDDPESLDDLSPERRREVVARTVARDEAEERDEILRSLEYHATAARHKHARLTDEAADMDALLTEYLARAQRSRFGRRRAS